MAHQSYKADRPTRSVVGPHSAAAAASGREAGTALSKYDCCRGHQVLSQSHHQAQQPADAQCRHRYLHCLLNPKK